MRTRKTHVVGQGEAVASLNFGGKDVDSEAEGKTAKMQCHFQPFCLKIGARDSCKVSNMRAESFWKKIHIGGAK